MMFRHVFAIPALLLFFASHTAVVRAESPNDSLKPTLEIVPAIQTVALMPFNNRAGGTFDNLSDAIGIIAGLMIQESGKAVIVNRDRVGDVVQEKRLADAGVTDNPRLGLPLQMNAADVIVFGYFDVINGELVITADLLPATQSDANKLYKEAQRGFERVVGRAPASDPTAALTDFATKLTAAIGAALTPEPPAAAPPAGRAVAVFPFLRFVADADTPPNRARHTLGGVLEPLLAARTDWKVVDREHLDAIMREHRLQLAGLTERGRALALGRLVGADMILIGVTVEQGDDTARLYV